MPYLRTRLGRWFYEERGKAKREDDPAIILLHGLLFDGGMWRKQVEPLAALGRVVIIDGPGHGKSEAPPRFSLEDHADALAIDAFAELRVPSAIIVGHSWGGMVGMRAAIQHPMRLAAAVLVDTSAEAEPLSEKIRYRAFIAFCRRYGVPRWFVDRELGKLMFGRETLAARGDELLEQFTRTVNGYPRDGMARAALAVSVHRTDVISKLRGIACPTLVVCGRDDRATPPSKSQALSAKIRDARLEWILACGHMSPIEKPEELNRIVVPFVKEQIAKA
jgi:3-oxoadipate enol-lactonase